MELICLSIAIAAAVFAGWNILYLILAGRMSELHLAERLSVSYGLGFGFLTLEMLFFYLFNMRFHLGWILLPWGALAAANFVIYMRMRPVGSTAVRPPAEKEEALTPLGAFLTFAIILEITYAFFRALIKPLESYDAIAIYAIKAKIFYLAGAIPQDFFLKVAHAFPHPDYPLNIPLAETFIYLFLGNLNDQLVKAIFPLYFTGILAMLYFGIRRFASRTYALLFTFLLASVPQFNAYAANGYLDLVFAYYYFTSLLFLLMWFKDEDRKMGFLFLSAVFAALAAWTKNEGLMYCGVNIILVLLFVTLEHKGPFRKRVFYGAVYPAVILIMSLPWLLVKSTFDLVNSDVGPVTLNPVSVLKESYKIPVILYEFQKHILGPKKWNILLPIAALVLIFYHRKAFAGIQRYVTSALAMIILGYVFIYLIATTEIDYFLRTTWSRFLIHFVPVVVYWLACLLRGEIEI